MPVELFANNAQTTLNGAINNLVTSLVVTSAAPFPTASSTAVPPSQFRIRVEDAPAGSGINLEFMRVTDVSGTTFTVARGQEGSTAASHASTSAVTLVVTGAALTAMPSNISSEGTLATRPAATAVPIGFYYFANDDNGGTMYRSNGTAWVKWAPGVLEGAGVELGYAEITSNFTTGTAANTVYPVTGLSVTVTTGSKPVMVEAFLPAITALAGTMDVSCQLYEDGTVIQASSETSSATANKSVIGTPRVRRNPAAGSHTYDVRLKANIANGMIALANAAFPAFIQVKET